MRPVGLLGLPGPAMYHLLDFYSGAEMGNEWVVARHTSSAEVYSWLFLSEPAICEDKGKGRHDDQGISFGKALRRSPLLRISFQYICICGKLMEFSLKHFLSNLWESSDILNLSVQQARSQRRVNVIYHNADIEKQNNSWAYFLVSMTWRQNKTSTSHGTSLKARFYECVFCRIYKSSKKGDDDSRNFKEYER